MCASVFVSVLLLTKRTLVDADEVKKKKCFSDIDILCYFNVTTNHHNTYFYISIMSVHLYLSDAVNILLIKHMQQIQCCI